MAAMAFFIKQKRPNCQISYIRVADCRFHIAPYKEFISGQAEPFLSRAGKGIGRFIKAGSRSGKAMAVLSRPASLNSSFSNSGRFIKARPVAAMAGLSPRSGRMARSLDLDCGWPISYCPVQAVYQRPSRAIFRKSWQSERTASKAFYKASYSLKRLINLIIKLRMKFSSSL